MITLILNLLIPGCKKLLFLMLTKKISEIVSLLRGGKLKASDLCNECLKRLEKTKSLNCFISKTPATANEAAKNIDQNINAYGKEQELLGIPVAVKDNFCTKATKTTCASLMLQNYTSPFDATVVNKLQQNGTLLMGKTNLDEFAMGSGSVDGAFGPVKNPWNYLINKEKSSEPTQCDEDFHIAGGSSGGSAVAVAVGAAFVGIGSDTGGSTRNPAALCGVVGLKPSYGRCSRHGLIPLINSMDVPGIITRSVDDAAVVLNCLSGHDEKDSTTIRHPHTSITLPDIASVQGLTIGIPEECNLPGLAADILKVWRRKADDLERGGAKVIDVKLPHANLSCKCYHVLCCAEVASNMARFDGLRYGERGTNEESTEALYASTRRKNLNDVVRSRILAGNFFLLKNNYEKYYLRAQKVRRLISEDFTKVFEAGVDLLLTPTALTTAPLYSCFSKADNRTRTIEQDILTTSVNLAGLPAINVPVSLSESNLPIGLQLIGRYLREDQLLLASKYLEQTSNFKPLAIYDFFNS